MWWGGFLVCGVLILLISVPFFAFPKELKREKRKVYLDEKFKVHKHEIMRDIPKKIFLIFTLVLLDWFPRRFFKILIFYRRNLHLSNFRKL
jgi:hypothetical protein